MIYDLTVTITIRRKDEYRDSLEVREQGVVFLDSFPEIAAVVQRFHELLEDVAGPSPAESAPRRPRRIVPKSHAEPGPENSGLSPVEKAPEIGPSE